MRVHRASVGWLALLVIATCALYASWTSGRCPQYPLPSPLQLQPPQPLEEDEERHVWSIFTKVSDTYSPIRGKLGVMIGSMLEHTSSLITLNLITDDASKPVAQEVILAAVNSTGKDIKVIYYDIKEVTSKMGGLVDAMRVHFTSQPGGYYSDSLFFVSLALHRVAPLAQTQVVMLDVDTKLIIDVAQLFKEFNSFSDNNLIGCTAELTPVYQHVLYRWRSRHPGSRLGSPASQGGFPGINSGVLLLRLDRIRDSALYETLLQPPSLRYLTSKYFFKGHLGDQDFYTLVALERPELFYMLDCGWNRQLCTWWRDHGYQDAFPAFASCLSPVRIYHGNCNTPIPDVS